MLVRLFKSVLSGHWASADCFSIWHCWPHYSLSVKSEGTHVSTSILWRHPSRISIRNHISACVIGSGATLSRHHLATFQGLELLLRLSLVEASIHIHLTQIVHHIVAKIVDVFQCIRIVIVATLWFVDFFIEFWVGLPNVAVINMWIILRLVHDVARRVSCWRTIWIHSTQHLISLFELCNASWDECTGASSLSQDVVVIFSIVAHSTCCWLIKVSVILEVLSSSMMLQTVVSFDSGGPCSLDYLSWKHARINVVGIVYRTKAVLTYTWGPSLFFFKFKHCFFKAVSNCIRVCCLNKCNCSLDFFVTWLEDACWWQILRLVIVLTLMKTLITAVIIKTNRLQLSVIQILRRSFSVVHFESKL